MKSADPDPPVPDVISLSAAAALVVDRLGPAQELARRRSIEARNVVALALSVLISIYRRDPQSGRLLKMTEEELSAGQFTEGATKFVFDDRRPEVLSPAVKQAEVDDAIQAISASFLADRYAEPSASQRAKGSRG